MECTGRYALGIFIDIEGSFDNAAFDSMCSATLHHGVDRSIVRWIRFMLVNRLLSVGEENDGAAKVKVEKGCPQGGVISPLLWCFVVDSLLNDISENNVHIQAYADDVCALVSGNSLRTVHSTAQNVLEKIDTWCTEHGLFVNPNKTVVCC